MRIENGIDPTCKEEYLSEDDFSQVTVVAKLVLCCAVDSCCIWSSQMLHELDVVSPQRVIAPQSV